MKKEKKKINRLNLNKRVVAAAVEIYSKGGRKREDRAAINLYDTASQSRLVISINPRRYEIIEMIKSCNIRHSVSSHGISGFLFLGYVASYQTKTECATTVV